MSCKTSGSISNEMHAVSTEMKKSYMLIVNFSLKVESCGNNTARESELEKIKLFDLIVLFCTLDQGAFCLL